jgi:proteasome lid subunit RPN8/RPN11
MASPTRPRLWLSETAWQTIKAAAGAAHPAETGGVLLGVLSIDGRPWITEAVTVPSATATHTSYELPTGARPRAVDEARAHDPRLGYLGDWHSHPADAGPSLRDGRTMRRLAQVTPDCPTPVLIIARRVAGDDYAIDARDASPRRLRRLDALAAGDLPPSPPPSLRPRKDLHGSQRP